MFHGKPIIGLAGGIGAGKSFVARAFAAVGCVVISSDELARAAYEDQAVRARLHEWWGGDAFTPAGDVDRPALARRIFTDARARRRLEELLHPIVEQRRQEAMRTALASQPGLPAFIWDSPLLFETGLNSRCDAVVFVDAPHAVRLKRVQANRKWDMNELWRREKLQWPLDKKRDASQYVVSNAADGGVNPESPEELNDQVRRVLAHSAGSPADPTP